LGVGELGACLQRIVGPNPIVTERVEKVVKKCLEKGLISFWFLSHPYSFRLSPPLNITEEEIIKSGQIILDAITETK